MSLGVAQIQIDTVRKHHDRQAFLLTYPCARYLGVKVPTGYGVLGGRIELDVDEPKVLLSASPTMRFRFTFANRTQDSLYILGMTFVVRIIHQPREVFGSLREDEEDIGYLTFTSPFLELGRDQTGPIEADLVLNHSILSRIEEIRANGDVRYRIAGKFISIPVKEAPTPQMSVTQDGWFEAKVYKSQWVEHFLPSFRFRDTYLLEIPRIDSQDFGKVSEYLNKAWKHKAMGDYGDVLTDCRNVLQETANIVKNSGFEKRNEEGDSVPDWKKFFDSEHMGEIFDTVNPKIWWFTSAGAHAGRAINREDADYALLITHAIANMVLKKHPQHGGSSEKEI